MIFDSTLNLAIFIVIVLAILFVYGYVEKWRRFPPGPLPLPVFGNLLQIDAANPHRSFLKWRRKYGGIYTVWLPKPSIVLADMEALRGTLNGPESEHFSDRPISFLYGIFSHGQPQGDGIILCNGEKWKKHRKFAHTALRTLGMGRGRIEERINVHKDALIHRLSQDIHSSIPQSQTFDMNAELSFCFGNIIHDLILGHHYDSPHDPEFLCFKHHLDQTLKGVASLTMLVVDNYPWMRHILPGYYQYLRDGFALQNFFLHEVDQHIEEMGMRVGVNGVEDMAVHNFMDAYLKEYYFADNPPGNEQEKMALRLTLALDSGDLWVGGMETVVTTTTWAILYLIHHPKIQLRLQTELDCVLLDRRTNIRQPFTYDHRRYLPYFGAFLNELQRIVNVLPWHIPHAVDEEVEIQGKFIPKGTTVMPQFGAVHFDEEVFGPNPEEFIPERFLPGSEIYRETHRTFNPFGMGKRVCLGEKLGKMELAVVLAALVQNFCFEAEDYSPLPSLERTQGMTSKPKEFRCRVVRR